MKTLFLLNSASGKRYVSDKAIELIHSMYREEGKVVDTRFIHFPSLEQTLQEAIDDGFHNIFAVGGDGTMNGVGTKLIGQTEEVGFGIIPTGSGNGFARNIGFSLDLETAIKQSLNPQSLVIDTGLYNNKPFMNVAGIGLDAVIAADYANAPKRGLKVYLSKSTRSYLRYQYPSYRITVDGIVHEYENLMMVVIANGNQFGYDARIAPKASLTDGLFDIIIVKRFPMIHVGFMIGRFFSGNILNSRYVEMLRGKEVVVESDQQVYGHIDGEPIWEENCERVDLMLKKASIKILLPNSLPLSKKNKL